MKWHQVGELAFQQVEEKVEEGCKVGLLVWWYEETRGAKKRVHNHASEDHVLHWGMAVAQAKGEHKVVPAGLGQPGCSGWQWLQQLC